MEHTITAIGYIKSPFKEKFGVPRQSRLVNCQCELIMSPPFNQKAAFDGLEDFSHIWLEFLFHQNLSGGWKASVRPPRLGGNQSLGVFATRSSFRPNGLGLSVVKLVDIVEKDRDIKLLIEGADLVDGTPVVDIKPYVPYADSIADASGGFAPSAPDKHLAVQWSENTLDTLNAIPNADQFKRLVEDTLALDPRPQYHKDKQKTYGIRLYDYDVQWVVENNIATIQSILKKS